MLKSDDIMDNTTMVVSAYIETIYGHGNERDRPVRRDCDACSAGLSSPRRAMSFLLALSAFGNVVIVTYIDAGGIPFQSSKSFRF